MFNVIGGGKDCWVNSEKVAVFLIWSSSISSRDEGTPGGLKTPTLECLILAMLSKERVFRNRPEESTSSLLDDSALFFGQF